MFSLLDFGYNSSTTVLPLRSYITRIFGWYELFIDEFIEVLLLLLMLLGVNNIIYYVYILFNLIMLWYWFICWTYMFIFYYDGNIFAKKITTWSPSDVIHRNHVLLITCSSSSLQDDVSPKVIWTKKLISDFIVNVLLKCYRGTNHVKSD